jgi:hypothetical protein
MTLKSLPKILVDVTSGPYKSLGTLVTTKDEKLIIAYTQHGRGCAPATDAMANARLLASSFELAVENHLLRDIVVHAKPLLLEMSKTSTLAQNILLTINETMKGN